MPLHGPWPRGTDGDPPWAWRAGGCFSCALQGQGQQRLPVHTGGLAPAAALTSLFFFFLVVLYNFVEESFALLQSTPCIDAHESLFSDAHSTISVFLLLSWLPPWTRGFLGALAAKKTARSCSHVTVCMSSHSGAHVSGTARLRMLPECPRVPGARHTARGPRGSVGFGARATC